MLRFAIVRKIFKNWYRCYGFRRERTPSSLQECLDPPPPKRGLWRNWFIILILLPALYYMIFIGGNSKYDEYSVPVEREKAILRPDEKIERELRESFRPDAEENAVEDSPSEPPKSKSEKSESMSTKAYYQIQRPRSNSREFIDLHRHPDSSKKVYSVENGSLIPKVDGNNTILARQPLPSRHKKITVPTPEPVSKYMPVCVAKRSKLRIDDSKVKPRNITMDMTYRAMLYKGGFYVPRHCRPRHKVAVLVAYRNRPVNLAVFLYNIHPFLIDQALEYRIFVVEQTGQELFNKGRLFNAGFVEAQKYGDWNCLVFHDVDLLPTDSKILYSCPTWPRHMSATILGKEKDPNYRSLFGGVTSMTIKQYTAVNGYSNLYWGWGGEDTDMFWRIKAAGIPIVRYSKAIAQYRALPHEKSPENPIRKQLSNNAMERYKKDGLSNVVYRLVSVTQYRTYTHFLVDVNPEHENITELQLRWS